MRPAGRLIQRWRSHDCAARLGFAAVRALLTPDQAGGAMNDVPKAAGLLSLDIIVVEAQGAFTQVRATAGKSRRSRATSLVDPC